MVNELFVLNEGVNVPTNFTLTLTADTYNINTSVNPNIVDNPIFKLKSVPEVPFCLSLE